MAEVKSKSSRHRHVRPRQAAMLLLRRRLKLSLPTIAAVLMRRDHTNIICGLRRAERLLERDPDWRQRFERAEAMLS